MFRCSSLFLFLFLFLFLQTCNGTNPTTNPHPHPHTCSPSACGVIRNISFPFRLKHDPKHCGYHHYELACENNVTLIKLSSKKHQVKAINYDNFTIRVVDATINNNKCSVPNYSAYKYFFTDPYSYRGGWNLNYTEVAWPINYMSCPYPLNNPSFLAVTNDCASNASNGRRTYIKVGHMNASEVEHMCRIEVIALTSWKFDDLKNVSSSEIRESLLYGFELSWFMYPCSKCKKRSYCVLSMDHTASCPGESYYAGFLIFVLVVGSSLVYTASAINLGKSAIRYKIQHKITTRYKVQKKTTT